MAEKSKDREVRKKFSRKSTFGKKTIIDPKQLQEEEKENTLKILELRKLRRSKDVPRSVVRQRSKALAEELRKLTRKRRIMIKMRDKK